MRIAWTERDAGSSELSWVVDAVELMVEVHVESTILEFSVAAPTVANKVVLTHDVDMKVVM